MSPTPLAVRADPWRSRVAGLPAIAGALGLPKPLRAGAAGAATGRVVWGLGRGRRGWGGVGGGVRASLVKRKWVDAPDYAHASEQLMAIQQDCKLQVASPPPPLPNIRASRSPPRVWRRPRPRVVGGAGCGGAIFVAQGLEGELVSDAYETHARIAIERCARPGGGVRVCVCVCVCVCLCVCNISFPPQLFCFPPSSSPSSHTRTGKAQGGAGGPVADHVGPDRALPRRRRQGPSPARRRAPRLVAGVGAGGVADRPAAPHAFSVPLAGRTQGTKRRRRGRRDGGRGWGEGGRQGNQRSPNCHEFIAYRSEAPEGARARARASGRKGEWAG